MGAQSAADLEDALSAKPVERNPPLEGAADRRGAEVEGRRREKAAVDLLVELPSAFGWEEGLVPIVVHGIDVPPPTAFRLDSVQRDFARDFQPDGSFLARLRATLMAKIRERAIHDSGS